MPEWVSSLDPWGLLWAAIAIIAAWIIAGLARRGVQRLLERVAGLSDAIKILAVRLTGYGIWLIGVGVALSFLGASIQPVIAVAIVVAVIVVLVLRGISDNFASGVVLQTRHPIAVGDEVETNGWTGVVTELNSRSVVLRTADGRYVHVPNSDVLGEPLVNNSRHGSRRSEIEVRVGTADRAELREAIADAVQQAEAVHRKERVVVSATTRADDRTIYRVRFWHHPLHLVAASDAAVDAVAQALTGRAPFAVTSRATPPPLTPPIEP